MVRYLAGVLWTVCLPVCAAADWPTWRGPDGQGRSAEKHLPLTWSATENVKWKVALPAAGNSTPIVWKDKVFVTQASKGGGTRNLMCLARADGKLLWTRETPYEDKEPAYDPNFYCSASPATDGERVVVSYGSAGMFCYDFSGKMLWQKDLGKLTHRWGNASSPLLHGDLAILWCGPGERQFLLAVNKRTGATVWEHQEPGGKDGFYGSWSTPLIAKVKGQDQLLLSAPRRLLGIDPQSGKELWSCEGLTDLVYTSPLYQDGIAVAMSGFGGAALAVQLGGEGDVTRDRLWHHPRNAQRVGSGVIVGAHVYILEETGVPHCYDLKTGKQVWSMEKRPDGGKSWSSMVSAAGRLYVVNQDGDTHVFAASPDYQLLATNRLGEHTNASIAISNGELFIRTWKHLWCIRVNEKKRPAVNP